MIFKIFGSAFFILFAISYVMGGNYVLQTLEAITAFVAGLALLMDK